VDHALTQQAAAKAASEGKAEKKVK